jgi:hypothetical protein
MMRTPLYIGSGLIGALMFQMPTTPPMKMGLWETTSRISMTGAEVPQGMSIPNQTIKARQCFTPESWAKSLGASQRQQQNCTRSNETWGAKSYSFDLACKGGTTGHFEMTFDSKESGHAVMHMNIDPGNGHTMLMSSTIESHFISADCGTVSPDRPEIIH